MKNIIAIFIFSLSLHIYSDSVGYVKIPSLKVSSKSFEINNNPLLSFDFITVKRANGDQLVKMPTIPLTYLRISRDEKYLVGLSELQGPCQLMIYDLVTFKPIYRMPISRKVVVLDKESVKELKTKYLYNHKLMIRRQHNHEGVIYYDFNQVHDDLGAMVDRDIDDFSDYLKFLKAHLHQHPLSKNISGTVSNYINWFHKEPDIKINNNKLTLLDPTKKRMTVQFSDGGRIKLLQFNKSNKVILLKKLEEIKSSMNLSKLGGLVYYGPEKVDKIIEFLKIFNYIYADDIHFLLNPSRYLTEYSKKDHWFEKLTKLKTFLNK